MAAVEVFRNPGEPGTGLAVLCRDQEQATQVNRIARRDDGEHLDTGGWVRLLEYATGQTARMLGKPSPEFFTAPWTRSAADRTPRWSSVTTWSPTSAVGRRSALPRLVRSGKGDRSQPGAEAEPDAILDSVAELPGLLQR